MATRHVYVISDLHLGGAAAEPGRPGFQMCPPHARQRLARFIAYVAAPERRAASDDSVELVINGDFVDFLAEQPFEAFSSSEWAAVAKLRQIMHSCDAGAPADAQVFPALRRFVAAGHRLTILLGNHDIELALPRVREELMAWLTGDGPARVEFLADGEACRRGAALIEHGNRYDGWNAVAHGGLRAYRARASRGEKTWAFVPPAGSQLVAQVMNPLKQLYRFVDLLKPENEAVIPILCALHPDAVREVRKVYSAWRARVDVGAPGQVPERESFVADRTGGGDPVPDEFTLTAGRRSARRSRVRQTGSATSRTPLQAELEGDDVDTATFARSEAAIADGEARLARLVRDPQLVPEAEGEVGDGTLAWLRSTLSLIRAARGEGDGRYRHLRDALVAHRLTIGTTFALDSEDPHYLAAARRLARADVRVVVFGHTHIPKRVSLGGGRVYLNTGTWCPTIQLDERLYDAASSDRVALGLLRRFVEDMRADRLGDWTCLRTVFAHIVVQPDGTTSAKLRAFHDDTSPTPLGEDVA